jgi:hypothetical protein
MIHLLEYKDDLMIAMRKLKNEVMNKSKVQSTL